MLQRSPSRTIRSRDDVDEVPLTETPARRVRLRRGGPRTPLPLLGAIAIAFGIGVAYVSQTAKSTQATYEATSLAGEQAQLRSQDQQLGDELDRLRASERIVAAAQQLGMKPASQWAYVASTPVPVLQPRQAAVADGRPDSGDPMQRLVAALAGAVGVHDAQAAAP